MSDILHFTLIMGAISSLFDAAMFLILVKGFHADETLFQTGWFLESIATQILVIFLIRSSRLPWRTTRSNAVLAVTSLGPPGRGHLCRGGTLSNLVRFHRPDLADRSGDCRCDRLLSHRCRSRQTSCAGSVKTCGGDSTGSATMTMATP